MFTNKSFEYENLIKSLQIFEPYYVFCIILIGFIGNCIIICLFLFSRLKLEKNKNYILTALAFSDNGFLFTLFLAYFNIFSFDFFNKYALVCKLTVYFTYVFGFLSAWFVVLFSIERTIAVYFPLRRYEICTCTRNKSSFVIIITLGLLLYIFSLKTSGLENYGSKTSCVLHKKWLKFASIMSFGDMLIAIFIPFIFILLTNTLISLKLIKFSNSYSIFKQMFRKKNKNKMKKEYDSEEFFSCKSQTKNVNLNIKDIRFKMKYSNDIPKISISNASKRTKTYSRTLRILFTISTTFLLLNFPIAMNKLWYFFKYYNGSFGEYQQVETISNVSQIDEIAKLADKDISNYFQINDLVYNSSLSLHNIFSVKNGFNVSYQEYEIEKLDKTNAGPLEEIIERISCYLYYLNFSINFFLYSTSGSNFRNTLLNKFRKESTFKHTITYT